MRIKLMGNGKRIENVVSSLCSDCTMKIYHCNSKDSVYCDCMSDIIHFMTEHNIQDIFYLELIEVGDL